MKRLALLVIVLFVALAVGTLYAQGYGRAFAVKIEKSDGEIKIDGKLDKENEPWALAIPFYIIADTATGGALTEVWQQFGTHVYDFQTGKEVHKGITDSSGVFYVLWDDKNMYVASSQYDDVIMGSGKNWWEQDGWEFYVDANHTRTAHIQYFCNILKDQNTAQVSQSGSVVTVSINPGAAKTSVEGGSIAANIDFDKGIYTTEAVFPLKSFNLDPTKLLNKIIGFDMEIDDGDSILNPHQHKLDWTGGNNTSWNTPATHGDLQFIDVAPKELRP